MSKKLKKGGPWITKLDDGSYITLQHWTDGTSSLEVTTLGRKDGKVVPVTEVHEWTTPQREERIEDYKLVFQSGKLRAVEK